MAIRQVFAGVPAVAVEEMLFSRLVKDSTAALSPAAPDSAHGADHAETVQCGHEFPAAKLQPAVGVKHAPGDVTAAGDRITQRGNGQYGAR